MKQNLEYTTKQINANFRIKVSGVFNGKKINKWLVLLEHSH